MTEGSSYFEDSIKHAVQEDYDIADQLGDGGFSVVYKGVRKSDEKQVAVKTIEKKKVGPEDLQREVNIWKLASKSSSRVVQLYAIYEDDQYVNLVMELMTGGELFEKIVGMEDYSEKYAALVIKQVLMIIRDLHKVHIVHQDLKPENLLIVSPENNTAIKLCDFGLAEIAGDDVELVGIVGSTTYMAPEVVAESGHSKPVDVYAAGVITYILLCGYPPFEPENGITELEFPEPEWDLISDAAKDLIAQLLDKNPDKRPTPEIALKHPWFNDTETVKEIKPLYGTRNTLRKYKEREEGGNGTMKEFRGSSRTTVFDVFNQPTDGKESAVESIAEEETRSEGTAGTLPLLPTDPSSPSEVDKLRLAYKSNFDKSISPSDLLDEFNTKKNKVYSAKTDSQVASLQKEIQQQISTSESLRKEILNLRIKLAEAVARREAVESRAMFEIEMLKKDAEVERQKRKQIKTVIEHSISSKSSTTTTTSPKDKKK
eukprot:TRINITY_DN1368_c0_g1_i1.p1 TRINITY_DN1368_c0_g1~~TRINITY_DN1368_c0_g1_i1.p1  ORF type:complete len:486 (-),score=152.75 TRINITY_DN1368_c0_g1_i1:326-1783(-)